METSPNTAGDFVVVLSERKGMVSFLVERTCFCLPWSLLCTTMRGGSEEEPLKILLDAWKERREI